MIFKDLKKTVVSKTAAQQQQDIGKTYGLIVDYCGITKDLQKALAIFEEEDIKGALEAAEKFLVS